MTYRNIVTTFWTDSKVEDDFTPEDKYFYLYLLTNPHTSLSGCYECSVKQMGRDMGLDVETIRKLLDRMMNVHKVLAYDYVSQEVLIFNWHKYNWSRSPKLLKMVEDSLEEINNLQFRETVREIVEAKRNGYGIDTVSIPYAYLTDTVTVTDTDTVSVKKKRFVPPTIDEVRAYCKERNNDVDPERFVDFYMAKGWKVGNQPMKDWKACVRTWEKKNGDKKKPTFTAKEMEVEEQDIEELRAKLFGGKNDGERSRSISR